MRPFKLDKIYFFIQSQVTLPQIFLDKLILAIFFIIDITLVTFT